MKGAWSLGAAALVLAPSLALAANHTVGGTVNVIKDPKGIADPSKRSVVVKLKNTGGPATIGDPTVSGAKLSVVTDAGNQCVSLPASGWTGSAAKGFKFKGVGGGNPAVVAVIKTSAGGVFVHVAKLKGSFGPINTLLQANTDKYNFSLGGGDTYCSTFGGTIIKNDTAQFKAKGAAAPSSCGAKASGCGVCGDSVTDIGETCDTGGVDTASCNGGTCQTGFCGDSYTNAAQGEQCDSGGVDTANCDGGTCTTPVCGDGHVNMAAGEVCDPPGSPFGAGPPFDNGKCDACLSPNGAFVDGPVL